MITLGIDLGSSSIKVSLFDALKGKSIAGASYPPQEMEIVAPQPDWAEQSPAVWMENLFKVMAIVQASHSETLRQVRAIGITYQMHGLVLVDANGKLLRNSIIWCDSRSVGIGNKAFNDLGSEFCLSRLLNSPGNFTASKLAWVKQHEPDVFSKAYKFMLPGDYIAYRLTNQITTTASGLSEGVFWDFENQRISQELLDYFGFDGSILPEVVDTFAPQGRLTSEMASRLGLQAGIPVAYRAGDQPNNAFSLKVLNPGEVAATAGTSGVIYGVTAAKRFDPLSRVNTFLHVNNLQHQPRLGILFCLNSAGILNAWARHELSGKRTTYTLMNKLAARVQEGSEGLMIMPFGNGAERMLQNRNPGASIHGLNLVKHQKKHLFRAIHESIAFAFNYGIEIMQPMGLNLSVIRAGEANLFQSQVFAQTLANLSGATIELYETNGAEGAARGAAIGASFLNNPEAAFVNFEINRTLVPDPKTRIHDTYEQWKSLLAKVTTS